MEEGKVYLVASRYADGTFQKTVSRKKVNGVVTETVLYDDDTKDEDITKVVTDKEYRYNYKGILNRIFTRSIKNYANMSSITVGKNVTSIGDNFLNGCSKLQQVYLPNSVTSIGANAFTDTALHRIVMSNSLTYIGASAFSNTKLQSITLPNSVKEVGNRAFCNCKSLNMIKFGEGIKTIEENTLVGCENLQTIFLPKSLTKIMKNGIGDGTNKRLIIYYCGTRADWKNVYKQDLSPVQGWDYNIRGNVTIHCTDGEFK